MKGAVIFDMDGVLLDTEGLIWRCWGETESDFGITGTQAVLRTLFGTDQKNFSRRMKEVYGAAFPYEDFHIAYRDRFFHIVETEGMPVKKGAEELLTWLKENGIKTGVASSTRKAVVEKELGSAGLLPYFDDVLGGDSIRRGKPEPDIYLLACQRLDVRPEESWGIEDSYNGVRAVFRAGMKAIMVPDQLPPTEEMCRLACVLPDLLAVRELLKGEV